MFGCRDQNKSGGGAAPAAAARNLAHFRVDVPQLSFFLLLFILIVWSAALGRDGFCLIFALFPSSLFSFSAVTVPTIVVSFEFDLDSS